MKSVLFLSVAVSFLFLTEAMALPKLRCITGLPTTSFVLTEKEDHIELFTIHHNGTAYAPIYNGVITPSDFKLLKRVADFYEKIGDDFTLKFEKEKCKIEEDKYYSCYNGEGVEINGVKITDVYFSTSESIDKIPEYEFKKTKVNLSLRVSGMEENTLSMYYYDDECRIGEK